jgi:hypothetical protein
MIDVDPITEDRSAWACSLYIRNRTSQLSRRWWGTLRCEKLPQNKTLVTGRFGLLGLQNGHVLLG